MANPNELDMNDAMPEVGRGAALLAFAGKPPRAVFATMVACAENLGRDLVAATVGARDGGAIATVQEVARVAAAVRRSGAAILVVAGGTAPHLVRRLAAACRRPVLLARTRQPWTRVLAATDLEAAGLPVVAAGAAIAASAGAEAVVLHNVAPAWAAPTPLLGTGAVFAARVARRLRRLVRTAGRMSPRSQVVVCASAAADRAIVDAVVARDADLLVVGMRRPARRLRARCADHVVAATPGNVLVIPLGRRRVPAQGVQS